MQYRKSSYAEGVYDTYWFEKNLQGDIVAVYSESSFKLISYTYDAWGNCTVTYHNNGSTSTARYNPFRYRGCYYDTETGFYYLNSRYYDPAIGRFISPDVIDVLTATPMDLTDKNLYAYCDNNPVTRADNGGGFWHLVVGGVIGGVIGAVSSAMSGGDVWDIIIGGASGAAGGVLAASGIGIVGQAVINSTISMASNAASQISHILQGDEEGFDVGDMIFDGAVGLVCGIWGGNGASYGNTSGIKSATKQLFKRGFFDPKARSYYIKNACRQGGDHVFKALLSSIDKTVIGSIVVTTKNIVNNVKKEYF